MSPPSLHDRPTWLQWGTLVAASAVFVAALEVVGLPAAFLLGPMLAAICVAGCEARVRVPALPFLAAQGVIGCMVSRVIGGAVLGEVVKDWPVFLAAVVAVIAISTALGWTLARLRIFPGSTAVWGSSPGAATVMALMAEAFGADMRLVAVMQYLRVVFVAAIASAVARLWVDVPAAAAALPAAAASWFAPIHGIAFGETLAIVVGGVAVGRLARIPAGPLLVPMVLGIVLRETGLVNIELPRWFLVISYAVVGWTIGLRFTRPILVATAHALPKVALSTLVLIAACGGLAVVLVWLTGVDPLTAYLATSPGGADSVAIIAASSKVDMPFVMAMQTARFVLVIFMGPSIARFVARRVDPTPRQA